MKNVCYRLVNLLKGCYYKVNAYVVCCSILTRSPGCSTCCTVLSSCRRCIVIVRCVDGYCDRITTCSTGGICCCSGTTNGNGAALCVPTVVNGVCLVDNCCRTLASGSADANEVDGTQSSEEACFLCSFSASLTFAIWSSQMPLNIIRAFSFRRWPMNGHYLQLWSSDKS